MNILWNGFAGKNHSWSVVAQNICREMIKNNHKVDIFSTNGNLFFPKDLVNNLIGFFQDKKIFGKAPNEKYEMQLSYTAMINFQKYLSYGNKNRFGIWNYEFTHLPQSHIKYYNFVDKILPSSNFSYEIFANNKIPLDKLHLIHHGIDLEKYQNAKPLLLNTNKNFKILANIAQPHIRKNISGLLDAYGKAFTSKDDVCLILKITDKKIEQPFEISFSKAFSSFREKYKKHAQCIILRDFIDDMPALYKACDAVFTMTHAEAFYLPGLEGLASGKIIISPRYGGQLDYLNDDNSILIDGKNIRAPIQAQYWESSLQSEMFDPSIDDAVNKLRYVYNNKDFLNKKFSDKSRIILNNFSWKKIVNDILFLAK